MLVKD